VEKAPKAGSKTTERKIKIKGLTYFGWPDPERCRRLDTPNKPLSVHFDSPRNPAQRESSKTTLQLCIQT
jgi:hypothetical protein